MGSARRNARFAREEQRRFLPLQQRGDSAAVRESFGKQFRKTRSFRLARHMMRKQRGTQEDVVQESFQTGLYFISRASTAIPGFFGTWLSRIAINAALMKLRQRKHEKVGCCPLG